MSTDDFVAGLLVALICVALVVALVALTVVLCPSKVVFARAPATCTTRTPTNRVRLAGVTAASAGRRNTCSSTTPLGEPGTASRPVTRSSPGDDMPPVRRRPARTHSDPKDPIRSAVWPRIMRAVVKRDMGRCYLCGHGPGPGSNAADSADHLVPRTEDPSRTLDMTNLRAVHHRPCEACSRAAGKPIRCNLIRGGYSIQRARRIIAERTGLPMPGDTEEARKPAMEGRDIW